MNAQIVKASAVVVGALAVPMTNGAHIQISQPADYVTVCEVRPSTLSDHDDLAHNAWLDSLDDASEEHGTSLNEDAFTAVKWVPGVGLVAS